MKVVKIEYDHTTFELEYDDDDSEWSAGFAAEGFSCSGSTPGEALDEAIRFLDYLETVPAAERNENAAARRKA